MLSIVVDLVVLHSTMVSPTKGTRQMNKAVESDINAAIKRLVNSTADIIEDDIQAQIDWLDLAVTRIMMARNSLSLMQHKDAS